MPTMIAGRNRRCKMKTRNADAAIAAINGTALIIIWTLAIAASVDAIAFVIVGSESAFTVKPSVRSKRTQPSP